MRFNGSIKGKDNTPTISSASGIWGLREQSLYRRENEWPDNRVLSLNYIGNFEQPALTTSHTFTDVDIGTPTSDRLVIACFHARGGTTSNFTGATCSIGTPITAVSARSAYVVTTITYLEASSGTTANFTANYSGNKDGCELAIYTLTGWSSATPTDTDSHTGSTNISVTLDIPVKSVAVYAFSQQAATVTGTWSSATETYDGDIAGEGVTTAIGAYIFDAGNSHTETLTPSALNSGCSLVGAVWSG